MNFVELHALRVFGRHGVYPEEQERGQDFLFDVELAVGERGSSDRLEEAVDYGDVARSVKEVSDARRYDLLGASIAAAVAAFERGATILRVHDVKPHVDALTVAGAIA